MDESIWNEAVKELELKNYSLARELFKKCGNNNEAQLQLAYLYQEGLGGTEDGEKAQTIYQDLANGGDFQGTYFLAKLFLKNQQLEKAAYYFEKSAGQSHISGAYWAAALHFGLNGYPKDHQKYWFFLKQAAKLGHIYARRDLAWHNVRMAKNVFARMKAYLDYRGAMLKGVIIAIRDPHDVRIR